MPPFSAAGLGPGSQTEVRHSQESYQVNQPRALPNGRAPEHIPGSLRTTHNAPKLKSARLVKQPTRAAEIAGLKPVGKWVDAIRI